MNLNEIIIFCISCVGIWSFTSYWIEKDAKKRYQELYEEQISKNYELECKNKKLIYNNDHLEFDNELMECKIRELEIENRQLNSKYNMLENKNHILKHTNKLIKLGNIHITAKSARSIVKIVEFESGCHIYFEGKKEPERSNLKAHAVIDKLKAKCIDLTC